MRFILIVLLAFLLLGCASQAVQEQTQKDANKTSAVEPSENFTLHVLYFYGAECQYSAKAAPTVDGLNASYAGRGVRFHYYETWHNAANAALYDRLADVYGIKPGNRGVPVIFIDGEYLMTFGRINEYLEQEINACLKARCPNPLDALTNASIAKPI
ncbi:MAG: hypothetical protein Q7T16_02140 [Candidatus Burarchaeum sp.]|nr:hypothetical protein [Candidatus Burarchaeum sp.]MDO8339434.1 hypothetical protein [Candidatus Burarchaeum sp.]